MPGTITSDTDLPTFIRAALGVDRSWVAGALCARGGLDETDMFRCNRTDHQYVQVEVVKRKRDGIQVRRLVRRKVMDGADRVAMAEMVCRACPAQWDCGVYALTVEATCGTWGVEINDLRALGADAIERAREAGVSLADLRDDVLGVLR